MMRKKKNSEETGAIPTRLTRQRRNLDEEEDADSTLVEKSSKSSRTLKTPSTARRTTRKKTPTPTEDMAMSTRSRRARAVKSSSDSDIENKAEDPEPGVNSTDSYPTRSRSKKDISGSNHGPIASSIETGLETEQKRQPRKKRVLTVADNTLTEITSPVEKKTKTIVKSTRAQAKLNPPEPLEALKPAQNSPAKRNPKTSALRKIYDTPRKFSPRRQSTSLDKSQTDTVTPESSPILINLTPHRSSKTPKKSPMNIGSPKSHAQSPLRLSKTPRKLTVTAESPATSDKSGSSLQDPTVVLTDFKKDSERRKAAAQVESPPNFVSVAKLRLRKSGEVSPANSAAAALSRLTVDEIWAEVSASSPRRKSPGKKGAASYLGSKIKKSPIKNQATPVKTPKKSSESLKRVKSTDENLPLQERVEILGAKLAPKKIPAILKLEHEAPESTPRGRIRRSLHLTPDFIKFSSGSTSSPIQTPQKTACNLSPSPLFSDSKDSKDFKDAKDDSLDLLNASNFMNVSNEPKDGTYELIKVVTPEEKEKGDIIDGTELDATYELAEPKTPSLRKKSRKRSLSNVEPDKCTPDAKKRCRVRFVSPAKERSDVSAHASLADNSKSLPTAETPAKQRIGGTESSRRRSRSLTKIDGKAGSKIGKRRSTSVSDLINKTPKLNQSTQDSVNRLSRPRQPVNSDVKSDVKPTVARKVPNFAHIHQKNFAEMESLVDAKKRVAKRHEELNAVQPTRASQSSSAIVPEASVTQTGSKPVPTDAKNGPFNRFGYRLRKPESVKLITKKPAASARNKSYQENNRSILKGVRTNRRFELQMKARNIKP